MINKEKQLLNTIIGMSITINELKETVKHQQKVIDRLTRKIQKKNKTIIYLQFMKNKRDEILNNILKEEKED